MQKVGLFHWSFLEIKLIKNPAIWLAENILAHISGSKFFPKYRIYAGTQQIPCKLMARFYSKFKTTYFWPIFGLFSQFWRQKKFFPKIISGMYNFKWVSSTMPKLQKNDIIPTKRLDRWKNGRKDGQTLFYRTLPTSALARKKSKIIQAEAKENTSYNLTKPKGDGWWLQIWTI